MTPGTAPHVVGVVPGAGASRRMGRPKALLHLGGRTFLDRVVRALRDGGCASVVVIVAEGDAAVTAEAHATGATVLENPDPGEGPITSLRLAIETLSTDVDAIAWLPLDHALVEARDVDPLLAAFARSGAPVTLPVYSGKRGHPAIFHRILFAELTDRDLEGGARTVVHRHLDDACLLNTERENVVIDIDTPEAYQHALDRGAAP